jgi:citrate/tricarballylate utilization protein
MPENGSLAEVRSAAEICNACRFCDSYCAVFPAMELQRAFSDGDLRYLAYLCHDCRGCYYACQAAPEPIDVNLPRSFAELRDESHAHYVWPALFASLFRRNGVVVSGTCLISITLVLLITLLSVTPGSLTHAQSGPGAFYQVIPWRTMASVASASLLFSVFALAVSGIKFWRESGRKDKRLRPTAILHALRDIATLQNLGGGSQICGDHDKSFSILRRRFHHAMAYGFLLCFLATCTATVYAHFFDQPAPYPLFSLPVLFGMIGGIGLIIGTSGLIWVKIISDPAPVVARLMSTDLALLGLLWLAAMTGLLLLAMRATPAMGVLLALHLGTILALFLLLPYSKFVHGLYRGLALLRAAADRSQLDPKNSSP